MIQLTRVAIEWSAKKHANFLYSYWCLWSWSTYFHWWERCWSPECISRWSLGNKGLSSNPESIFLSQMSVHYYTHHWYCYSHSPLDILYFQLFPCSMEWFIATTSKVLSMLLASINLSRDSWVVSFPLQNSVIVMNNCWIHKDPEILNMINAA